MMDSSQDTLPLLTNKKDSNSYQATINSSISNLMNSFQHKIHLHNFLGTQHHDNETRTKIVIILCFIAMIIEIIFGILFQSLALVADGIHMSTHVTAFCLSGFAYYYARKHADDKRFVFGTGKVGELSAFTSAIILLIIACVILSNP